MRYLHKGGVAALFAALLAGAAAHANPIQPWKPVTDAQLLKPADGDWINYRRTYDGTGFSPLTQIDKTNVGELVPVWSYAFRDNERWEPTPLAVNGMVYVSEGSGRLLAFDAETGDVIWIHERKFPRDIARSHGFGRTRGVSVYGDLIYWGTADCTLLALNARTGELVWEVNTGDYSTGDGLSHPPLIADGKLFLSHAGGDRGVRGRFRAYDAKTGKLLWTTYTVPAPGEPGSETWPRKDVRQAGAAPWNTATYDPALKLVYVPTGQPTPWSMAQRGGGDALYANSVVAMDAATGKIKWHYQMVPQDNWDRAVFEPMLVDLTINGRNRRAMILTSKAGWGVVLDRASGAFISAFKTAYDNQIMGYDAKGRAAINPASIPKPEDVGTPKLFEVCPHYHGARNLNAPSYSPLTKLYYLGANNTCMDARTGGIGPARFAPGYDYVGEFAAFNPVTGEKAWTHRVPGGVAMSASALATASNLVFGGSADGEFFALDAENGKLLWQTRLSGDVSAAPVSYEVNGREYIAIAAGGRTAPANSFARVTNTHLSDGKGVLWVFALRDTSNPPGYRPRLAPRTIVHTSGPVPAAAPANQGAAGGAQAD